MAVSGFVFKMVGSGLAAEDDADGEPLLDLIFFTEVDFADLKGADVGVHEVVVALDRFEKSGKKRCAQDRLVDRAGLEDFDKRFFCQLALKAELCELGADEIAGEKFLEALCNETGRELFAQRDRVASEG